MTMATLRHVISWFLAICHPHILVSTLVKDSYFDDVFAQKDPAMTVFTFKKITQSGQYTPKDEEA